MSRGGSGITLVMPSLLIVFGFLLFPFLYSFVLSLMNYDLARPQGNGFIGLGNYTRLTQDTYFLNSVVVTLVFSFASVILEIILGVAIALVMNQDFRGRGILRALIIIPWALPSIVNASMWSWILNANYGALNALLSQLGILHAYRPWIADPGVGHGDDHHRQRLEGDAVHRHPGPCGAAGRPDAPAGGRGRGRRRGRPEIHSCRSAHDRRRSS